MGLILLVFLGGVLTIVSPCILPVLPFVFARAERRFVDNGLPMLGGMSVTFAAIATLAAVGGSWAISLNTYGRDLALLLLTLFALTLLSRHMADWLARPFVALGNRLSQSGGDGEGSVLNSALLGVATGLLWAPCAGPILGLIFTGAAIAGPSVHTTLLLFAYAAGAATSLALALLAGGRVFSFLKRSLGAGEWVRRGLGVAVLAGVVAILLGWDTTVLTRLSLSSTGSLEQTLIDRLHPSAAPGGAMAMSRTPPEPAMAMSGTGEGNAMMMSGAKPRGGLPVEGEFPGFAGGTQWLNSPPLTAESLRGKVVLVDFWTYSCINCLRALPYVEAWYEKYKDHGLVVVGVHAPEFAFEKDPDNVRRAIKDLKVSYPVVLDNSLSIWQAFNNMYWPAHYFIDAQGQIRAHHFGEGDYAQSESTLRRLLMDAGHTDLPPPAVMAVQGAGAQAPPDEAHVQSPETYVGYARAEHFAAPGGFVQDRPHDYRAPEHFVLNSWSLAGRWTVGPEKGVLQSVPGRIVFRFQARDLHLVLGPAAGGAPVRFRVSLDGAAPGANHGVDTDAAGNGTVGDQRLYQLVRQAGDVGEHTFTIEFLDPGVEAYSFTFG